jgi:hypothetical protein
MPSIHLCICISSIHCMYTYTHTLAYIYTHIHDISVMYMPSIHLCIVL